MAKNILDSFVPLNFAVLRLVHIDLSLSPCRAKFQNRLRQFQHYLWAFDSTRFEILFTIWANQTLSRSNYLIKINRPEIRNKLRIKCLLNSSLAYVHGFYFQNEHFKNAINWRKKAKTLCQETSLVGWMCIVSGHLVWYVLATTTNFSIFLNEIFDRCGPSRKKYWIQFVYWSLEENFRVQLETLWK